MLDADSTTIDVKPLTVGARRELPPRSRMQRALAPLKYAASLVAFLCAICYMLFVGIMQGIGMLAMYLVMPPFMKIVYPSRLGRLHIVFLSLYRKFFLGDDGHSRSIRIDLLASPGFRPYTKLYPFAEMRNGSVGYDRRRGDHALNADGRNRAEDGA